MTYGIGIETMMKQLTITLAFLMTLSSSVAAQDFDKGLAAYKAGNYTTAVEEWTPLAEQGVSKAQTNLGVMYENGQGLLQDNVMAHMWYNIGAANGNELGGTNRGIIANKMTPADISKAQAMARECMSSDYTKCGY